MFPSGQQPLSSTNGNIGRTLPRLDPDPPESSSASHSPPPPLPVTKATQTDFSTSHPDLSPLGYALQEGHFEDAVALLKSGAALKGVPDFGALLTTVFDRINQRLETDELFEAQAQALLSALDGRDILSRRRDVLAAQAYSATAKGKETQARVYVSHMDMLGLTIEQPWHRPTIVHTALQQGLPEIAKLCLERGADLYQKTSRQENLILLAVRLNQPTILPYLLERNLDINDTDFHGENALHQALLRHNTAMVNLVLDNGIHIDAPTAQGDTPLHLAITQDNEDALESLLSHGADPGFPNQDELLPLQLAVSQNKPRAVALLINYHAPTNIVDEAGRTLIQLARASQAHAVTQLLVNQGLLRTIRNDEENAHDSVVNEGFAALYNDLLEAVPEEKRYSFNQAEPHLRDYLAHKFEFTAIRTLNTITQEGRVRMAHLNDATEQDVVALIWSLTQLPQDQTAMDCDGPLEKMTDIDPDLIKQSLTSRLKDGWNSDANASVCPSGRINRLLDTFTGLYAGAQILSRDILQREMLDKAALLRDQYAQSAETQIPLNIYIREKLAHDYVESGIISQELFDRILDDWIDYIE